MPKGKGTYGKKRGRPANMEAGGLKISEDTLVNYPVKFLERTAAKAAGNWPVKSLEKLAKVMVEEGSTRGPNLDELSSEDRKYFKEFYQKLLDADKLRRGTLVNQPAIAKKRPTPPRPKPKPTKKKKMMGGGMAGKKPRMGHMDYRKGGMVYKTTKG